MLNSEEINFRTVLKANKYDFDINYKSSVMFLGSCFTENIGKLLKENKFNIDINPFGILYNPLSVKNGIDILLTNRTFTEEDLFYYNERWHSFLHHSRFSNADKEQSLKGINNKIKDSSEYFKNTDYLFITFGTSWVYKLDETNVVVSNCHKIPAGRFNRKLLNSEEIVSEYSALINQIKSFNKGLKIIFTISPVRHIKDGLSENNLSKSILRIAIEKLINNYSNCYYFPAYELLIDDLRDYRFYESDFLHPNKQAIDYIFNYFKNSYFTEDTFLIFKEIQKTIRAKQHKPYNKSSKEYQMFIKKNLELIKSLDNKFKGLDFSDEISFFNKNKKSDKNVGL